MASVDCSKNIDMSCRNKNVALDLKIGAVAAILVASALGVLLPLFGKKIQWLRTDGNVFFVTKAFAAGVILATGFCHMLNDAQTTLSNPCLPYHPWGKFPWFGFFSMLAALGTLVVDFLATDYYERKHGISAHAHVHGGGGHSARFGSGAEFGQMDSMGLAGDSGGNVINGDSKVSDIEKSDSNNTRGHMHIVGLRAHAASHSHSHADGQHGTIEPLHHAGHTHTAKDANQEEISLRHIVISQVLELGIVAHSVIIGITLGVSESPCTIRPLMAALVFHQFFEGFALGGCISQAGFKTISAGVMATFFAVTTPFGICLGLGVASSYNENSPQALIVEGVLDAFSAGILIYMALVDLIAADFLSKRLRCDRRLQVYSYVALFGGAGAMSALAIWA